MAEVLKVLGQSNPAINTLTPLYTVPAARSAVVSSISVCNTTGSPIHFRISIAVAGAADNIKQYVYYDIALIANDTFIATVGITLATTDIVRCYSDNANTAFSLFGTEIS